LTEKANQRLLQLEINVEREGAGEKPLNLYNFDYEKLNKEDSSVQGLHNPEPKQIVFDLIKKVGEKLAIPFVFVFFVIILGVFFMCFFAGKHWFYSIVVSLSASFIYVVGLAVGLDEGHSMGSKEERERQGENN